jgi:hypothetical protein
MRWDPQVVSLLNAQVTEGYLDIFFCGSFSARNGCQSPCLGIIPKSWKSARQPRNRLSSKEWPPLRGEGLSVVYQKFEKFYVRTSAKLTEEHEPLNSRLASPKAHSWATPDGGARWLPALACPETGILTPLGCDRRLLSETSNVDSATRTHQFVKHCAVVWCEHLLLQLTRARLHLSPVVQWMVLQRHLPTLR